MHNSLHIRDLLRRMNADPEVRARRQVYRHLQRDPVAVAGPDELALSGPWRVTVTMDASADELLATDLRHLLTGLGVTVLAADTPDHASILSLQADPRLPGRAWAWTVTPEHIAIRAGNLAGAWAAVAWLGFEMQWRRGPFLPLGQQQRQAAWEVQISQGPWGANYSVPDFSPDYLSDDCFRLYAQYGVTSMMIYGDLLCYTQSRILPELNHPQAAENLAMLQDAARRAARYGVRFTYIPVGPKLRRGHPVFAAHPEVLGSGTNREDLHFLCSSEPKVLDFYAETFGALTRAVPELAGFVLIVAEESFYYCKMWRHSNRLPCPRCTPRSTEEVLASLLTPIVAAVRQANPEAFVAAWPYTTTHWEHPDRLPFIRQMPADLDFWLSMEKDQLYQKAGYLKNIWDYSIDYGGPSDNLRLAAAACREVGRRLWVKTETGIGLEVFQFPYVPAMQRLADKWQRVRELAPIGVHQAWLFFGMFGSRAEALGLWAAYAPDCPRDTFLRRLAQRDFGPAAVAGVMTAWERLSAAMGHLPVLIFNTYYIGPSFLGPCHPLPVTRGQTYSEVFHAYLFYLQEHGETFAHKHINETRTCLVATDLRPSGGLPQPLPGEPRGGAEILVTEYAQAAELAGAALAALDSVANELPEPADRANFAEERVLAELIYRTLLACHQVAAFIQARDAGDRATMRDLARRERANALAARPLYAAAPWLDYPMRLDGIYAAAATMIDEKVRLLDAFLGEHG
jgi:hypothetical protein